MKQANVVSVRDVTPAAPEQEWGDSAERARIETLLRSYPATSAAETSELLRFFTTGSQLDIGLVEGKDEFGDKVKALRKRFKSHFGARFKDVAWFAVLTLGPAGLYLLGSLLR